MSSDTEFSEERAALSRLSATVGADIRFVQGAGGNSSIKDGDVLWVKASGTWLSDANKSDIFVPVDLGIVRQRLAADEEDCAKGAVIGDDKRRASIEVSVHALMPQRVVFHVHCVDTLRWGVMRHGREEIARRLAGFSWAWVPYQRPGLPLAWEIERVLAEQQAVPDILVLQNHGLVACGENGAEVLQHLQDVRQRLGDGPRNISAPGGRDASAPAGYRWSDDALIAGLANDPLALGIARRGVLYPDHVVFLGAGLPEVRAGEDIDAALTRWQQAFGTKPVYLVVPGKGVLVSEQISSNAIAMLQAFALVALRIRPADLENDGLRYLSHDNIAALTNWDAEVYRQQLAKLNRA